MKKYGYDLNATHSAAIFEKGTEAEKDNNDPGADGIIVGTSEWIWMTKDNARRICAALCYFSETGTDEIERLARERFKQAK